jgi:hypothetical protein
MFLFLLLEFFIKNNPPPPDLEGITLLWAAEPYTFAHFVNFDPFLLGQGLFPAAATATDAGEIWSLFWTEEMLDLTVLHTNR